MSKVAKHIDDIPEDIYIQIPYLIYNSWKKQFMEMSKYASRIADNKMEIPNDGKYIRSSVGFYINKSTLDPLELTYKVFFRIKTDNFISVLNNFMHENNIHFDFDIFYDKIKLLNYINKELSMIFKRKFYIEIDIPYTALNLETTLKTKSDVFEL